MDKRIADQVVEHLSALPQELQWRVLEFAKALVQSAPHGVPGRDLLPFGGALSADEAERMRDAIEQGCEQWIP